MNAMTNYIELAREAAHLGSAVLLRYQKKLSKLHIESKMAQGVVSEADRTAELTIMKYLRKEAPEISFFGEETSYLDGQDQSTQHSIYADLEWCWCIDPLDGTHNYLNGLEYYCVSVALLNYGKPVVGVILRPVTGECYWAIEGKGAFYQDVQGKKHKLKLDTKKKKRLKDCLVVTGFSSEKGVLRKDEVERFARLLVETRGVRRLGSAALDLCLVARGIFDAFWEKELAPWDVAAGGLIAKEAGAFVGNWQGRPFNPFDQTITASLPVLKSSLQKLL